MINALPDPISRRLPPLADMPVPLLPLQPILYRIVRRVAEKHPGLFERLGKHQRSNFVIELTDLPLALHLRPFPPSLILRAVRKDRLPKHEAHIAGDFRTLLGLLDAEVDGDAIFFSRDLVISGDTEAVVTLRNALDDVEGSIAEDVAEMFGAAGRMALARLNAMTESQDSEGASHDNW
ncbi:ubiquinone anaerobic biosynthesis accessory factor UbiT [Aliiruegeria lutimaris]|uniref:Predicted lipid carrier protein YhbT, contains SCP2 domain n=1 Tax=Aliiruegeria lutimaris TaxID=571298 RepID=A0A1G8TLK0_9RHOB|nr:SCP2 sterol-binding domain-containing protein [Aliiruegeria lutimaris]SDJ42456.1 Predicted lipid carrier protein YhbT, contains SCP2 domain [Aliiruegeria lutimaris]